jgi:hypothetical protein
MNSLIRTFLRPPQEPVVRALYYALILAVAAWLAAIDATATPTFIYQAF